MAGQSINRSIEKLVNQVFNQSIFKLLANQSLNRNQLIELLVNQSKNKSELSEQ